VSRLEADGYVERTQCADDRRATNTTLTAAGWKKVVRAAPGHVSTVRYDVVDALTPVQITQLSRICERLLARLDPDGPMFAPAGEV
jgi:DNA-binding MarR family transcriptional regulator